ncbi:hypothetical protein [Fictibacillus gelatini]|uniref:hypothetical protein n=1 Tax=Fictibacillus gelatini TaxID=225985 RepID=UPI0004023FC6|nr:hypothetical protein [Fictibacillus gelatini]
MNPVLKMHMKYKLIWMILPWTTLLFSFAVNLLIAVLVNDKGGLYTGGVASIFIFMFVAGITIPIQTFPFSLGLSVRRKDYFLGMMAVSLIVSAISAAILSIFSFIESDLTGGWGYKIHFFSLLNAFNTNIIWQFGIFFILLTHMCLSGFIIYSIYQRFGRSGMLWLFVLLVLLLTVLSLLFTYFQWWIPIFQWIAHHPNLLVLWILLASCIYAALSYLLLRKAAV